MSHAFDEDLDRLNATWHEVLSTSRAGVPALSLVNAPQASFEVTTLTDVVDANDGVLSLREAITLANDSRGPDTITFADSLRGETIKLTPNLGPLQITDDLLIDGDPLDRGPVGIKIDGNGYLASGELEPILIDDAAVRLEDLTVQNFAYFGIRATDASLDLERVTLRDPVFADFAYGIDVRGGSLRIVDSTIGYFRVPDSAVIRLSDGADVAIYGSTIGYTGADNSSGIFGEGNVKLVDSVITQTAGGGFYGWGARVVGTLTIEGSTISGNGSIYGRGAGVEIDGTLRLVNSSVVDNFSGASENPPGAAVRVLPGSSADIINSTITGTTEEYSSSTRVPSFGLYAGTGSTVRVINSIINDSIEGTITSNGANTFRDAAVNGAVAGDRLGVHAEEVFAVTRFIGNTTALAGVLADNGGPTPTVALLASRQNPALDSGVAADTVDAAGEPLPFDQRGQGFARVFGDGVDLGAFELQVPALPDVDYRIVTTLDDVINATDGVVSLREAIAFANGNPGHDEISFAPGLGSGAIRLTGGPLPIVDELSLSGSGVTLIGEADGSVLDIRGATVALDQLALADSAGRSGINAVDSAVTLNNVAVVGGRYYGIQTIGSTLTLVDSMIADNVGYGIRAVDSHLTIHGSVITNNGAYYAGGILAERGSFTMTTSTVSDNLQTGIGLVGVNDGSIADSVVAGNGGGIFTGIGSVTVSRTSVTHNGLRSEGNPPSGGITAWGDLIVEDSTVAGNVNANGAGGIDFGGVEGGAFTITNSTVIDNFAVDRIGGFARGKAGGIDVGDGHAGQIINTTVTGNIGRTAPPETGSPAATAGGLAVADEASVGIVNSIVLGNEVAAGSPGSPDVTGTIKSSGTNIFGQAVVAGAVAGDLAGVTADQVFATTGTLPMGTASGVLADNGGPTQTVALLNSPDNPALDNADPADAPPTDQRGFPRGATPDIGAFELGPTTLPPLVEGVPVPDEAINSVPREALTLTGGRDAAISFVDEVAAFQSSLGVYLVGSNGEIVEPRWVFERIEHALPDDQASDAARPGGGPSSPGATVLLSDLFDSRELQEGTEFGLFLVADGAARNPFVVFDGGTLAFRTGGGGAEVTDITPRLVHVAENGVERVIQGDIMHTIDAGSPNPLSNTLNPGGKGQALSGLLDAQFVVAFEDKPFNASDKDFNDALFAVELLDNAPALFAAPASAAETVGAVASLETLLFTAEMVA